MVRLPRYSCGHTLLYTFTVSAVAVVAIKVPWVGRRVCVAASKHSIPECDIVTLRMCDTFQMLRLANEYKSRAETQVRHLRERSSTQRGTVKANQDSGELQAQSKL